MQRRTVLAGAAFIASEGLLGIGRLAAQQPKHGGAASIAQQGTVNMLDVHTTQVTAIRNIAMHIFECLVTRDEHMNPIADLATGWTVANDGLSYTFPLRQGITFHNGKQLTSADVKASFERYARVGMEPDALTDVVTTETPDATTVVFRLRNRVPTFIEQISSIRAPIVIMPTEESSKEPGKIAAIGTGPYALDRFPDGSTVTLRKYQNYRPNDAQDGTSGFGGRKLAYFDSLTFHNVPEPGARIAGLQTGLYDVVEALPPTIARRLSTDSKIKIYTLKDWAIVASLINLAMPPTDNLLIRRAMQAALDMDEIMAIAGDGDYTLQPSWQYPNTAYYTEAGKEKYNIHDTDLAKQLLVQAGYKNEPIVMLATSEIKSDADASIVITEQLRAVGMNIVVHVYDAAVASETRFKKHGWNINSGQFSSAPADGPLGMMRVFSGPTPSQHASPPGWNGLITELSSKSTLDERREVFSEVQQMMYDDVIALKIGDLPMKQATRSDIMNFSPYIDIRMWNVWRG